MLFKPELRKLIREGKKTQTRRPVKTGEVLLKVNFLPTFCRPNGNIKMQVGREYAVQYGYGKPIAWYSPDTCKELDYETYLNILAPINRDIDLLKMFYKPLRIRVLDIRQEPILSISLEDAIAEGFQDRQVFLDAWRDFYKDKYPIAFAYTFEVV